MKAQVIEVPADGQTEWHDMKGLSAVILQCEEFVNVLDCPRLQFDTIGANWPIEPRNVLPNDECQFKRIGVTGTAASAGTQVIILPMNQCLGLKLNPSDVRKSYPGNTKVKQMDDTVQSLTSLDIADDDGNLPKEILISVGGTGDILMRWNDGSGADPAADGEQSHLIKSGAEPFSINGIRFIKDDLKIVNAVTGETPYFIYSRRF